MANVNQEIGRAAPYNQQIALNDTVVRTLFGKASGVISMSDGYGKTYVPYGTSVAFTAGSTTWTVPAGVTSIKVKAWANGGASGSANGGGAGYITGILSVTPGSTLTVNVEYPSGYLNIAEDCSDMNFPVAAEDIAQGGHQAYVYRDTSSYIVAGGGGGGSLSAGGAGGGTNGLPSAASTSGGQGAQGNTGGARSTDTTNNICNSATDGKGANYSAWGSSGDWVFIGRGGQPQGTSGCGTNDASVCNHTGAEGGWGWAGGGAGSASGGGGSSGSTGNFTSVTNTAGSGTTPGNNADSDYVAGKGVGATTTWGSGGAGYIVIRY